jgi:hypothetical protein
MDCAGILEQSLGARNQVGIGLSTCRTGPPGYILWRNRFLRIDSWAPKKVKNTVSIRFISTVAALCAFFKKFRIKYETAALHRVRIKQEMSPYFLF